MVRFSLKLGLPTVIDWDNEYAHTLKHVAILVKLWGWELYRERQGMLRSCRRSKFSILNSVFFILNQKKLFLLQNGEWRMENELASRTSGSIGGRSGKIRPLPTKSWNFSLVAGE
jgi:hypothetical protein